MAGVGISKKDYRLGFRDFDLVAFMTDVTNQAFDQSRHTIVRPPITSVRRNGENVLAYSCNPCGKSLGMEIPQRWNIHVDYPWGLQL